MAFSWHAAEMMAKARVRHIEDLTGHDRVVMGCMALAFDLNDADFDAICQRLTPWQVEKARVFRAQWVDAALREPQMAEIRRDIRDRARRATQERADRRARAAGADLRLVEAGLPGHPAQVEVLMTGCDATGQPFPDLLFPADTAADNPADTP